MFAAIIPIREIIAIAIEPRSYSHSEMEAGIRAELP
jgi:hypothetical protein